ncbi:MAG TPA: hypothetical protein VH413_08205 [Verrucomicrobiae bacterium]|jgi:hypothetical protein|nr:hypothetical protein [Verrucomicrobiae bacterium]
MKISPEPLHPLRNWRELWQVNTVTPGQTLRMQVHAPANDWKQSKQPAFHWLNQLVNRDSSR